MRRGSPKPRILDATVITALFILGTVYFVTALSTGDLVWILPYFAGEPARIVLYRQGESVEIAPDSPDYRTLNDALNRALSSVSNYHETLGMSDQTLADYRARSLALEIFYPQPVVIHSRFHFGRPNTLFIPLAGYHSQYDVVFGGINGSYWPGGLGLKGLPLLKEKLVELGYLSEVSP